MILSHMFGQPKNEKTIRLIRHRIMPELIVTDLVRKRESLPVEMLCVVHDDYRASSPAGIHRVSGRKRWQKYEVNVEVFTDRLQWRRYRRYRKKIEKLSGLDLRDFHGHNIEDRKSVVRERV